jgi:hypothetical protein
MYPPPHTRDVPLTMAGLLVVVATDEGVFDPMSTRGVEGAGIPLQMDKAEYEERIKKVLGLTR